MGIDPKNNISDNNKSTLCSYIILTVFIEEGAIAKQAMKVRYDELSISFLCEFLS
jgi:hypothetical protein